MEFQFSGRSWNMILQAETSWRAAAAQLEALTKTHDGVMGQLREAQDRTALAEQEKIEVSPWRKLHLLVMPSQCVFALTAS